MNPLTHSVVPGTDRTRCGLDKSKVFIGTHPDCPTCVALNDTARKLIVSTFFPDVDEVFKEAEKAARALREEAAIIEGRALGFGDVIFRLTQQAEDLERVLYPAPDPEALIRHIAGCIASGVVWENREDLIDVKDVYREWMRSMDEWGLLETAQYALNPDGETVNADHD
jgi:hypothetical protein